MDIRKFLEEKGSKKGSVEKRRKNETDRLGWDRTDVLYSFRGIYALGLYVFDKESGRGKFKRKKNDIIVSGEKNNRQKLYSRNFIIKGKFYETPFAKEINNLPIFQEFLDLYYSIGNVIPIWPGGNSARGISGCYDLAHIYFSKKDVSFWFEKIKEQHSNAYFDEIFNDNFKKEIESFLDELTVKKYEEFLTHVCKTIKKRSKLIEGHL